MSVADRLEVVGPCDVWPGPLNVWGYGQRKDPITGRNRLVHCIAWEAYVGPIPPGYQIHHLCDNHPCMNVKHLLCVSTKEHRQIHAARITHCPHNHPYSPENTYVSAEGHRTCRTCKLASDKHRREKKKEMLRAQRERTVLVRAQPQPLQLE